MQNVIFSTANNSFPVANIIHAGQVTESSEKNRKSENTHYFRIITIRGTTFCNFKSEETARRSRSVLGTMLEAVKPHLFRHKGDCIDIASIVSFGRVVTLKGNNDKEIYGFPVQINTAAEKAGAIWLTCQAEESARNVRKALFAAILSFYQVKSLEGTPEEVKNGDECSEGQEEAAPIAA